MARLCVLLWVLPAVFGQLRFDPTQLDKAQKEKEKVLPSVSFDNAGLPICPEDDGVFQDPSFCDAYWKCNRGVATEVFCEDGLVFDPRKALHSDPCDTPHVVPCGDRQELQEPTFPNEFCPRKYGVFEHPDPTVCYIYYQCVDSKPTETHCSAGLHFNGTQGSCNWPAIAKRDGCIEKPKVSADGAFSCPPGDTFNAAGVKVLHPSFPNADDCSKFYVCLNGDTPQAASCDRGLVFDERSMLCAMPDTVPECVGWYANDPDFAHYYDEAPAGGADPGNADVAG